MQPKSNNIKPKTKLHQDQISSVVIRNELGWEGYGLYVALLNFSKRYGYTLDIDTAAEAFIVDKLIIVEIYDLINQYNLEMPNKKSEGEL